MIRNKYVIFLTFLCAGLCIAFLINYPFATSVPHMSDGLNSARDSHSNTEQATSEKNVRSHSHDGLLEAEGAMERKVSIAVDAKSVKIRKQTIAGGEETVGIRKSISEKDTGIAKMAEFKVQSSAVRRYKVGSTQSSNK
ncbi:hypothetical protein [Microbulbifer aggregans]|uniref:hypothetical protein n=1 Tax=Microbulbifer aggregans TaxID=1769779 RepID=UPI001CFE4C4C|nr:hypothetical protein [Microbulbifer aggregans]